MSECNVCRGTGRRKIVEWTPRGGQRARHVSCYNCNPLKEAQKRPEGPKAYQYHYNLSISADGLNPDASDEPASMRISGMFVGDEPLSDDTLREAVAEEVLMAVSEMRA